MDFASIRIITGDVARLAGFYDKATGVHEGKKEGRNVMDTMAGRDQEARGRLPRARFRPGPGRL